jgi:hypothetical protein
MECMIKDRIGSHVPKLFGAVAGVAFGGESSNVPETSGASEPGSVQERLKTLQAEAQKALLLVGTSK